MLLYGLTILISAFLLFQVQPMIAKIILPWFGGSAAVWTVCILFFQVVLLLGYLYAHAVVRYLKPRAQMVLHVALLAGSAIALPIFPGGGWKPTGTEEPTGAILRLLALTVGLPYFLLSTTGPLLQAWYARSFKGAMPYRLYALSNAGSMFALVSYPALFEPVFTTHQQANMWSFAYGAFAVLCGFAAFRSGSRTAAAAADEEAGEKPGARLYLMWLLLPACASVLLLAITNHLSANVAAIPFLWVLPLSIYLLTFILCFEGSGWYRRSPYLQLLAVALGSMAYAASADTTGSVAVRVMVPLFGLGLFTCCMVCHGELARLKPHPRYLTHFYLMISAGGALGGIFVGLVAPHFFKGFYEMPLGLAGCAVLALMVLRSYPEGSWLEHLLPPWRITVAAAGLGLVGYSGYERREVVIAPARRLAGLLRKGWNPADEFDQYVLLAALVVCAALVLAALRGDRGLNWARKLGQWGAFATEVLALVLAGYLGYQTRQASIGYHLMVRNFYGSLKVKDTGAATALDSVRTLTHGTINHGEQYLNLARRDMPTTYYGPKTGVGIAIRERGKDKAIRVGVIGLGTGTLATYGRLGDYYRFYEINPLVPQIARSEFTFVSDSKAKVEFAMGTRGCRWSGKRRSISTCWRWMRFRATRFRCTC